MEIHHTKHHQAYITNVNNALKDQPALAALDVDTLIADLSKVPEAIRGAVRNNGGGARQPFLLPGEILGPGKEAGAPKARSATRSARPSAAFDKFKEEFAKAMAQPALAPAGAWLVVGADKKLSIGSTANQDSPLMGQGGRGHRRQTGHRPRCVGTPPTT